MLGDWWGRTFSTEKRPFDKVPLGTVMLHFYRWCASRLEEIRSIKELTAADLETIASFESTLNPPPEPTDFARLVGSWRGKLTSSGDPIWDSWVRAVESGDIPDAWYGPVLHKKKV